MWTTISTIVRPENIEWYKQLGESGVRLGAKRYKRSEPPDFERRVYEAIGKGQTATTKAEIARVAESIARSQDLPHFGELLSRAHCCFQNCRLRLHQIIVWQLRHEPSRLRVVCVCLDQSSG